jgi:hypothetical protein
MSEQAKRQDQPAANAAGKQRGRPFIKGQSGNPSGKRKGTRGRATLAAEALLDGEARALTRKAIEMALAGDVSAMRLCMERLLPPRKDRPVQLTLPQIKTAADAAGAMSAIVDAVGRGEITAAEGREVAGIVETFVKALEAGEFEQRLAALEAGERS